MEAATCSTSSQHRCPVSLDRLRARPVRCRAACLAAGMFASPRCTGLRTRGRIARALLEREGGSGVLERPGLDLSKLPTPSTESGLGGGETQKSKKVGGGSYRLMLLDHERHTEKMVVQAITTVIPGTSPDHALNCYNTAKKLGQAIITSCIKEIAEFYSEQLSRQGISNMIEPDTTTL